MGAVERRGTSRKVVAPGRIPHVLVPLPRAEMLEFMRDALRNTSLLNSYTRAVTGWAFFEPHVTFTAVDAGHTLVELDLVGTLPGADKLLFVQRRGEIDRFFVAIQDELDRRERWRSTGAPAIESP